MNKHNYNLSMILGAIFLAYFTSCTISLKSKRVKLEAEVCEHRWGMKASFTQSTDRYLIHNMAYAAELYGLKYNIPLTVFEFKKRGNEQSNAFEMGRIDFGVYSNGCRSQDLELQRLNLLKYITVVTQVRGGKRPSTLSYGCNNDEIKNEILDLFLLGRNSNTIYNTYYQESKDHYNISQLQKSDTCYNSTISIPSTTRYFHLLLENQDSAKNIIRNQMLNCYNRGGFYSDFCHWQAYKFYKVPVNALVEHFENMHATFDSLDVYRGSYNDIAEYYYAKQSIDNVNIKKLDGQLIVTVSASKKELINYGLISTPVSIRINLSTDSDSLYKNNYASKNGGALRKMEDGDLILDIPVNFNTDSTVVSDTLFITNEANYLNFAVPVVKIINNRVHSDQKVKVTLFRKEKHKDARKISICERSLIFKNRHYLSTKKNDDYDYFLGYINATGNSGVVKWIKSETQP